MFAIQSASTVPAEVQILAENLVAAADEGAVVANVQKKAMEYGVLTQALKEMPRKLPPPVPAIANRLSVGYELVRFNTVKPTAAPTTLMPTMAPSPDAELEEPEGSEKTFPKK